MFHLRDKLRSQRSELERSGCLSFHDCSVQHDDVMALDQCIQEFNRAREIHPEEDPVFFKSISFIKCKFDSNDEQTLTMLRNFFQGARPHLDMIMFHSPTLSNERVGELLQAPETNNSNDGIREFHFCWSFARAAALNRHSVFQDLRHCLRKLTLEFQGLEYFGEINSDFAIALPTMENLQELELRGWAIRDIQLQELVTSVVRIHSLRILSFKDIKGLNMSGASLEVLGELGRFNNEVNLLEQDNSAPMEDGSEESAEIHVGGLETLELHNCRTVMSGASEAQIAAFVQTTGVQNLVIKYCNLPRVVVRALLSAVAKPSCGLASFGLQDSSFGQREFELLLSILPHISLRELFLHQIAISDEPERHAKLRNALELNTTLTKFQFSGRRYNLNQSTDARIRKILKRNQRARFVNLVLTKVPTVQVPKLLPFAFAKLAVDGQGITEMQQLLLNRVSTLTHE